ncbi:right-handed parallel beta-helix repeat-containing protein [Marinobacter sp. BSs20148]|uniref:right-handed parallel beta-helix repeat-containing protein n=1 Tax=Marinobacter sp. BSs20148 TaxID=490759 RepID=UPI0002776B9D|nr:right-handed parallel beta-helix repeat-containing protein [Marinobacter sp. BSs20148]AFP31112.1 hypothetical protein MRBBS_2175 [Marinobacter sp. BSs20148]
MLKVRGLGLAGFFQYVPTKRFRCAWWCLLPRKTSTNLLFCLLLFLPLQASASECVSAALPASPKGAAISVKNVGELYRATRVAQPGSIIVLAPGDYRLTATLSIRAEDITLRGAAETCNAVKLIGPGMEAVEYNGAPNAIWSDAVGLRVQNLTIKDFHQHGIVLNPGAESPVIQNVLFQDIGMQSIKANPSGFGDGVDDGRVENSVFVYTNGPSTKDLGAGVGYTNAVDVHAGKNWVIRNNRFENFHTPDTADYLWNPAILMWNGARGSIVEGNTFVDVDRAIAFGLMDRHRDHFGGVIRNNRVDYSEGLYSPMRKAGSDAAIIVWSSPGTLVEGNEVLTRGNLRKSIEFRFDTDGAKAVDNLVDAPIGSQNGGVHEALGNRFVGD